MYAAAHPGKMGDCCYSLPLLRYLYESRGWTFDFYSSKYCAPLKRLFEYQPYINQFIVSDQYVLRDFGCGCQPPDVPIPGGYEGVYQLGFHRWPDQMLHQFIGQEAGFGGIPLGVEYKYPEIERPTNAGYICIAPNGGRQGYADLFADVSQLFEQHGIETVIIGGDGDYLGWGHDHTGKDALDTVSILSGAMAFVGLMSLQLVLANGFDIPRVAVWPGTIYDMRHVLEYHRNIYLTNPLPQQVMAEIDRNLDQYGRSQG